MDGFIQSEAFATHVNQLLHQHHVSGLSIAIIDHDRVASAGFGHASASRPCTADTLFDIASCSKSLTAAAIALLIDENPDLKYDTPACDAFPAGEFVMSSENHTTQVTIDDMLSHRTGMAPHNDSLMGATALNPDDARSVTLKLRYLPVAAPVRSRYMYNNMMYTVLTYLIEHRSGLTFENYLRDRVFHPLDMNDTYLQPSRAKQDLATGHIWDKQQKRLRVIRARDFPEGQGAGSVISSAKDMVKWVRALLQCREPITERIYSELIRLRSFVNPYSSKRQKKHTSLIFYAAGLDVYFYRGYMIAGHNGVASGFASKFMFMPECKFGLVILANSDVATGVCTMLTQLLIEEVLCVSDAERSQRLQKSLKRKARRQDDHQVVASSVEQTAVSSDAAELARYVGLYSHPGYGQLQVQLKSNELFIDATDRSNGFTLVLKSIDRSRTRFTADIFDYYDYIEPGSIMDVAEAVPDEQIRAEFDFVAERPSNELTAASRLGIRLESNIEELIWFDRTS